MSEILSPHDSEVIDGRFVTDYAYLNLHFITAIKRFMVIDNFECKNIHHILSDAKKTKLFNTVVYGELFKTHLRHQFASIYKGELVDFGIEKKKKNILRDIQYVIHHVLTSGITKEQLLDTLVRNGYTELEKMGILPTEIKSKLITPYMWGHDHPIPGHITETLLGAIPEDKWKEDLKILVYPCGQGEDAEKILHKLEEAGHNTEDALNMIYLDDDRPENVLFAIARLGGGINYKDV